MAHDDPTLAFGRSGAKVPPDASDRAASGPTLKRGDVVGRYLVLQELGRGGMGVVYSAYDPELERKIAIKLLRPEQDGRNRDSFRARLLREAQALAKLSHPNVIQVYDAGLVGDEVFIAIELVEGETLAEWLRRARRPLRQVVEVFLAAGRGLSAAHAASIVHRDFKPANVLLGADGRVRVLDFGTARLARAGDPAPATDDGTQEAAGEANTTAGAADAKMARAEPDAVAGSLAPGLLDSALTRAGWIVGTPRYMAPELFRGSGADQRSDQFAFCVALYEAVYGAPPPHDDGSRRTVAAAWPPRSAGAAPEAVSHVPAWLRRVLGRGLAASAELRYPSMDELLAELGRDRTAHRRRWLGATAAALLVAVTATSLYRAGRRSSDPSQLCRGAERHLAGIWDAAGKANMAQAFGRSRRPYAAAAWQGTVRTLDGFAAGWVRMHEEACAATLLRGEQSSEMLDLRMQCLEQRRKELGALAALFAAADDGVVEHAVQASQSLPGLDQCADTAALAAPVRLPANAGARRAVEALRGRLAIARALWTTGRYGPALVKARDAAGEAERLGYLPVRAEALHLRALAEESAGDPQAAERTLYESLEAAQAGRHDRAAAEASIDLVKVIGFRAMRFDDGERWARFAGASIARLGGNTELEADLQNDLGLAVEAGGKPSRALGLQLAALAGYRKVLPAGDAKLARTMNCIGTCLIDLRRYDEAAVYLRRALADTESALGPDHPTVAVRLGNLGMALEDQGRYAEALADQRRAIAIEERALGSEHPQLADSLTNLGHLLGSMDRWEEGLAQQRRALAIEEKALGPTHPDVAASLANIGEALYRLKRYDEALPYGRRAAAALTSAVGVEHPWTAVAWSIYGRALLALGRPAEALQPLRRSLAALQRGKDADPDELARVELSLARAQWAAGGDRAAALDLGHQARRGLAAGGRKTADELALADAWLASKAQ